MAKLIATRGAQWPLVAEFTFNVADTVTDASGATRDFATAGQAVVFDALNLPGNATVTHGEVVTELAVSGSTAYTVSAGDVVTPARYFAATDVKAAGRYAFVPTGFVGNGENLRITVTPTGAATAGKVTVRITYVIRNRQNEVQTV